MIIFGGNRETIYCEVIMRHFQACMSTLGIPIASAETEDPTFFWGGGGA